METEEIRELIRKAKLGKELTPREATTLKEHLATEITYQQRYDLDDIFQKAHGGNIESEWLKAQNARRASLNPHKDRDSGVENAANAGEYPLGKPLVFPRFAVPLRPRRDRYFLKNT